MNTSIIADSSGLISLISETDKNHSIALQVMNAFNDSRGSIIVPSDVFSETLNALGKKIGHDIAKIAGGEMMDSGAYIILESSANTRLLAFELFNTQPESVSFTDCIVMAFADRFNTKDIFGFDKAFKTNGYHRIGFDER